MMSASDPAPLAPPSRPEAGGEERCANCGFAKHAGTSVGCATCARAAVGRTDPSPCYHGHAMQTVAACGRCGYCPDVDALATLSARLAARERELAEAQQARDEAIRAGMLTALETNDALARLAARADMGDAWRKAFVRGAEWATMRYLPTGPDGFYVEADAAAVEADAAAADVFHAPR